MTASGPSGILQVRDSAMMESGRTVLGTEEVRQADDRLRTDRHGVSSLKAKAKKVNGESKVEGRGSKDRHGENAEMLKSGAEASIVDGRKSKDTWSAAL